MIGNLSQFWRLTRELDLNGLRQDLERETSIRIFGTDLATAERVARMIAESGLGDEVQVALLGERMLSPVPRERRAEQQINVVALDGPVEGTARRTLTDLRIGDAPLLLVQVGSGRDMLVLGLDEERVLILPDHEDEERQRERLLGALVRIAPEAMLGFARRHPTARAAVAEHLIRDTSRVNAQFAALSSLPAVIPVVGNVVGSVADMVVLTKNQLILLFKLAGLHGRDLALGRRLLMEIVPVVGGAFVWRTTARALVGMVPGVISAAPKVLVAYTGTYLVGEMAHYYYEHGRRPPTEHIQQLRLEGMRLGRGVMDRIKRR